MTFDFVPDDYGDDAGDGSMLNADDYALAAGIFDGSKMGPPGGAIVPHLGIGGTSREVRHRDSTPDSVQWYIAASLADIGYFWKMDGINTAYRDVVSKPSDAWQISVEQYQLSPINGQFVEFWFYGNDDFTSGYLLLNNWYSNYVRLLKKTPGQNYYWNGSAWQTSGVNLGSTSCYSAWNSWTVTFRPGDSFDIACTRGTGSDTNITEDLGLGSNGGPVCLIATYGFPAGTGEKLWTREIHRDYYEGT